MKLKTKNQKPHISVGNGHEIVCVTNENIHGHLSYNVGNPFDENIYTNTAFGE